MNHYYEHLNKTEGRWLRDLLLLSLVLGCLFLWGLGSAPLIDPDEGRYAEIPREMLERGNLITPTLNYVKYFEKPPLLYWVNAASMALFGQNEFAARLPSALSGLLTVLLTYVAGRRLYDRRTGLLAAVVLGGCAGFLIQSRIILTDMLLTLCLATALFAFILATRERGMAQRLLFYLFFAACGLAILTKGLIGIVLPGGIIFWYLLLSRQWGLLRSIPWLSGCAVLALVTTPWFLLVSRDNPEFPHFFFIREHFQRFTSTIHKRSQPFWFFLPMLLLTMLPWSFLLPGGIRQAIQERQRRNGLSLYLLVWPLVILLFFSLSSSKLIPYILPIFPPLALIIAHRLSEHWHQRRRSFSWSIGALGSILTTAGILIACLPLLESLAPLLAASGRTGRQFGELIYGTPPVINMQTLAAIGAMLALPGVALLLALRSRSTAVLLSVLVGLSLMLELALPYLHTRYTARQLTHRDLAQALVSHAAPQTLLAQSGPRQGLNFYSGKRLVTVGDFDELAFGSQQGQQQEWFLTWEQFHTVWLSSRPVLIVLSPAEARRLQALPGDRSRVLFTAQQALLLANR